MDDERDGDLEVVEQMKTHLVQESENEAYDALVQSSKEGTIFHSSWWQNVTGKVYGESFSTKRYGISENGRIIAAFPVSSYDRFGHRIVFNSKLTPYSGPIFFQKADVKKVTQASWKKALNSEFAKILRNYSICLHYPFAPNHCDLQPYFWEGFSIGVHYTHLLNIDDLTAVWDKMHTRRRSEIKKAYLENYHISYGAIDKFISLNNQTMNRQHHAQFPSNLWKDIFRECRERGCCEVFTAHDDEGPIASLCLIWDNKRSYYIGGGIRPDSQYAMSLIFWEAIKYSKNILNLSEFDFEGSSEKSIEFFFRRFGGEIHPIYSVYNKTISRELLRKTRWLLKNITR